MQFIISCPCVQNSIAVLGMVVSTSSWKSVLSYHIYSLYLMSFVNLMSLVWFFFFFVISITWTFISVEFTTHHLFHYLLSSLKQICAEDRGTLHCWRTKCASYETDHAFRMVFTEHVKLQVQLQRIKTREHWSFGGRNKNMQKLKKEDHQSCLSAVHMQNVMFFWFAFYVPFLSPQSKVNPCALGSYLSMVDPWYNSNIRSLGSMIPKLADMVKKQRVLCLSYLRSISTVDSRLVLIIHPLRKCHHFTTLHFRQWGEGLFSA